MYLGALCRRNSYCSHPPAPACNYRHVKESSDFAEEAGMAACARDAAGTGFLRKEIVRVAKMSLTSKALAKSLLAEKRQTSFRNVFGLLAILALTTTAFAQQENKDLSDVSLEELGNIQVYSASKHMQSASEAPASVTVVTADEIQKYGYRNLADVLRSVPGFYVTYDRDYTFVGVRGFGRLGDWNSRILVLIDGHRSNNNILGQAMLGNEFLVDIDMVERVEIVCGPSSSLYGANAFFAVINVITRTPKQVKDWELSFQTGSFGTNEGRATYGHEFNGLGVVLSGTFYNSSGQTLFFPQFDNPANNHGITSGTDFESYKHILATLTYDGFTLQGLFSTRDKGVPTAYFGAVFNDPGAYNIDSHQYISLDYQHPIGKWQLDAGTSYDQARLQGPVPEAPTMASGPVVLSTYSFRGNWWTGEVKVSRDLFERNHLTFGSEVRDNVRQDQGDLLNPPNVFTPEAEQLPDHCSLCPG